MIEIKNKNDLLNFIVENSTDDYIYQYDCVKNTNLSPDDVVEYAKQLIADKYITSDITNYYLTNSGKQAYKENKSPMKKVKFLVKPTRDIIIGVIVAVVAAIILFIIGIS